MNNTKLMDGRKTLKQVGTALLTTISYVNKLQQPTFKETTTEISSGTKWMASSLLVNQTFPEFCVTQQPSSGDHFVIENVSWWINGVCQLLVGILGFLANCVSLSILCRSEMANNFNRLLACLAFTDNMHLLCTIVMSIITIRGQRYGLLLYTLLPQLHAMWSMCSIYTTLALAVERYNAVAKPQRYRSLMITGKHTLEKILWNFFGILIISFVFNLPTFFETFPVKNKNPLIESIFTNHTLQKEHSILYFNYNYQLWYKAVARLFVVGFIPFVVYTVTNIKILRAIYKIRKVQDSICPIPEHKSIELEQAYRFLSIVTVYFAILLFYVTKKFYLIVFISKLKTSCLYECFKLVPMWVKVTTIAQRFIADISSIFNLIVFIHTSQKFCSILLGYFKFVSGMFNCVRSGRGQTLELVAKNQDEKQEQEIQESMS